MGGQPGHATGQGQSSPPIPSAVRDTLNELHNARRSNTTAIRNVFGTNYPTYRDTLSHPSHSATSTHVNPAHTLLSSYPNYSSQFTSQGPATAVPYPSSNRSQIFAQLNDNNNTPYHDTAAQVLHTASNMSAGNVRALINNVYGPGSSDPNPGAGSFSFNEPINCADAELASENPHGSSFHNVDAPANGSGSSDSNTPATRLAIDGSNHEFPELMKTLPPFPHGVDTTGLENPNAKFTASDGTNNLTSRSYLNQTTLSATVQDDVAPFILPDDTVLDTSNNDVTSVEDQPPQGHDATELTDVPTNNDVLANPRLVPDNIPHNGLGNGSDNGSLFNESLFNDPLLNNPLFNVFPYNDFPLDDFLFLKASPSNDPAYNSTDNHNTGKATTSPSFDGSSPLGNFQNASPQNDVAEQPMEDIQPQHPFQPHMSPQNGNTAQTTTSVDEPQHRAETHTSFESYQDRPAPKAARKNKSKGNDDTKGQSKKREQNEANWRCQYVAPFEIIVQEILQQPQNVELMFGSLAEARNARSHMGVNPAGYDPTIPTTDAQKRAIVRKLVGCFLWKDAGDNQKVIDKMDREDSRTIELACWELLEATIERQQVGRFKLGKGHDHYTFETRMAGIMQACSASKSLCRHVIVQCDESYIHRLVDDPFDEKNKVKQNINVNEIKRRQIDEGKQVVARERKRARRARNGCPHSANVPTTGDSQNDYKQFGAHHTLSDGLQAAYDDGRQSQQQGLQYDNSTSPLSTPQTQDSGRYLMTPTGSDNSTAYDPLLPIQLQGARTVAQPMTYDGRKSQQQGLQYDNSTSPLSTPQTQDSGRYLMTPTSSDNSTTYNPLLPIQLQGARAMVQPMTEAMVSEAMESEASMHQAMRQDVANHAYGTRQKSRRNTIAANRQANKRTRMDDGSGDYSDPAKRRRSA
ncbi:hypothetical protein BDW59DRAFT_158487 [Aspergillus cavernicola]|uniref:Uncharacterized protein n=1 Tax=Aspergillus cavernicola TaxID=176166 RepID=A0ABR4IS32_9EURO